MRVRWFHPVPELRASIDETRLTLETPWVRASVVLTPETRPWAVAQVGELGRGWIAPSTPMAQFIAPFLEEPLWIERAAPPCAEADEETDPALRFARLPAYDAFDSIALLSAMRWHAWSNDDLTNASEDLARAASESSKEGLHLLLRQELEVTRACDASIRPACAAFPEARAAIERFLAQEGGHDALLAASLEEVPGSAQPVAALIDLLAHLADVARTDFLGLCGVIDLLEGLDDVWRHFPDAPKGARTHAAINAREKHARAAEDLVVSYAIATRDAAVRGLAARARAEALVARANRQLVGELTARTVRNVV